MRFIFKSSFHIDKFIYASIADYFIPIKNNKTRSCQNKKSSVVTMDAGDFMRGHWVGGSFITDFTNGVPLKSLAPIPNLAHPNLPRERSSIHRFVKAANSRITSPSSPQNLSDITGSNYKNTTYNPYTMRSTTTQMILIENRKSLARKTFPEERKHFPLSAGNKLIKFVKVLK